MLYVLLQAVYYNYFRHNKVDATFATRHQHASVHKELIYYGRPMK